MMRIKQAARALFHRFGWDVRRMSNVHYHHADLFFDQQRLLRGLDVGVIFDVGANIGQTAQRYRILFPNARIHSFEPFPDAFDKLSQACTDKRITPHRLAVSDAIGKSAFFVNAYDVTNSLLPATDADQYVDPSWTKQTARIEVETTTLDAFCQSQGIDHLSILKMDIQGGELAALRGADQLLSRHAIDLVQSEVLFASLYQGQTHFCDLYRLLERHGYKLYGLYNEAFGKNKVLAWCDALFISPQVEARINALS